MIVRTEANVSFWKKMRTAGNGTKPNTIVSSSMPKSGYSNVHTARLVFIVLVRRSVLMFKPQLFIVRQCPKYGQLRTYEFLIVHCQSSYYFLSLIHISEPTR